MQTTSGDLTTQVIADLYFARAELAPWRQLSGPITRALEHVERALSELERVVAETEKPEVKGKNEAA